MGKPSKAALAIKELEAELEAENARHHVEVDRIEYSLELLRRLFRGKGESHASEITPKISSSEAEEGE